MNMKGEMISPKTAASPSVYLFYLMSHLCSFYFGPASPPPKRPSKRRSFPFAFLAGNILLVDLLSFVVFSRFNFFAPHVPPTGTMKPSHFAMDAADSCDSSSQQEASSSSNSQDSQLPPAESLSLRCLWKNCHKIYNDMLAFYHHVHEHALHNMAGPCLWQGCPAAEQANRRERRHQSFFMEHHINTHFPKNAFKVFFTIHFELYIVDFLDGKMSFHERGRCDDSPPPFPQLVHTV